MDVEMVRWIGRARFAQAEQVAALAVKGRARLDSIVSAYVRERHIAAVRYFAAPAAAELFDIRPLEDRVDLSADSGLAAA